MPTYLYSVTAKATIREVWAVDSPQPLTEEEFMDLLDSADESVRFVSDEVEGDEEDRVFRSFDGEED